MKLRYEQLCKNFITVRVVENIKLEDLDDVPKFNLTYTYNNELYCIDHEECYNFIHLN